MQALLSFDQAPPYAAPLRFFLTAPLFLSLFGVLLFVAGDDMLVSRWSPAALAATHLLTVGFMLTTMLGALIQVLPVVAGANLHHPLSLARALHVLLTAGGLALSAAFIFWLPELFVLAAGVLALAAALFLLAVAGAMHAVPTTSPTIGGLKLAFVGLLCTVALGVVLALALGKGWSLPLTELVNLHASWGLAAWAGVLLAALSYVVVPMFQLTPAYPARLSRWLPVCLFALPWLALPAIGLELPWLHRVYDGGLALAGLVYVLYTLHLQRQRRRARRDVPYLFWQFGLWLALLALTQALAAALFPAWSEQYDWWAPLFGALLGAGGFVSLLTGMLYRIVPFLAWLHLQDLMLAGVSIPSANDLLSGRWMARQLYVHVAAVLLLLLAIFVPQACAVAGGLWIAAGIGLLLNLLVVVFRYRHIRRENEK